MSRQDCNVGRKKICGVTEEKVPGANLHEQAGL